MIEYRLGNNKKLLIYNLHEALTTAGVNETDDVFAQDTALEECFRGMKVERLVYNGISYSADLEKAVRQGVEVLIILEDKK